MARKAQRPNRIVEVLVDRDGMTKVEATRALLQARAAFNPAEDDPDEVLASEFGLEPDYIADLLWD